MTRAEFEVWKLRYAPPFGMTSDTDNVMFDSWFDVFVSARYTVAELDDVRRELHLAPPKNRWEHLTAIHDGIRSARRDSESRRQAIEPFDPSGIGVCAECGDSGMVVVPHPGYVTAGVWVGSAHFGYRPTAAVTCRCYRGRRIRENYDSRPTDYRNRIDRPMGLEQYQRSVPNWKAMLLQDENEKLTGAKAAQASSAADKALGPLGGIMGQIVGRAQAGAGAT